MVDILGYIIRLLKEQGVGVVYGRSSESILHQICRNPKATRNAVEVILQVFPDLATRLTDIYNEHAVHILCQNELLDDSESIRILDLLMEFDHQDCSRHELSGGRLSLHLAARHKGIGFVKHLVDLCPHAVHEQDEVGGVPFHHACSGGSIDVCKYLLGLWPESLTKTDNEGWTPIHWASDFGNEDFGNDYKLAVESISFLLENDASLASIPTSQQELLPLHQCCQNNFDGTEAIEVLFDAHPKAICIKSGNNQLPIELVPDDCQRMRSFLEQQMQYYRLSQDIHALSTPDQLGELTLHRAVRDGATLGAIKLLVGGYPDALRVPNTNGDCPLHIASARLDGFGVVSYLMAQHPPALLSQNRKDLIPLQILCLTRAEFEDEDGSKYTDCLFKMMRAAPLSLHAF